MGHNYIESILQDNLPRQVSQEGIHLARVEPKSQLKDHFIYPIIEETRKEKQSKYTLQTKYVNIKADKWKHKYFY